MCGGPQFCADGYLKGMVVYDNGVYMTLEEHLQLNPLTEEELNPPDEPEE